MICKYIMLVTFLNVPKYFSKKIRFQANKGKKQKVPRTNYYRHRLQRWHSASGKYTRQAETLLHSLERAAAGIGLHVRAHETEYMCFNQTGDISTLNGSWQVHLPRKQCFINRDRHQHATSKGMDTYDRRLVMWKSDLTDKMKRCFCKQRSYRYCCMIAYRKSLTATTQECCEQYWTSLGDSTPQSSSCTATYHLSQKLRRTRHAGLLDK